jgi:cytochrome c oxidase assembly protein subunit 15
MQMQNQLKKPFTARLVVIATILTLIVIMLGAYTRLKDAGLGCPDWPGCYGYLTVPQSPTEMAQATAQFPETPVEAAKAWPEMVHRYVAGTLGFLILLIAIQMIRHRMWHNSALWVSLGLLALVIFQALLGMWTVTMRLLPIVVMGHLLGGMAIFALLTWLNLRLSLSDSQLFARRGDFFKGPFKWVILGLIILIIQIALGGWVSANYAALICPDVLSCEGQTIPTLNFQQAFQFISQIGPNYQGGLLDTTARVTIQYAHRVWAIVTAFYLLGLSIWIISTTLSQKNRDWHYYCAMFPDNVRDSKYCLVITHWNCCFT